jgi:CheY-like chemotaxis protein
MPIKHQTYSTDRVFFQQKDHQMPAARELGENRANASVTHDSGSRSNGRMASQADIEANRFPFSSLKIIIAEDHAANREYSKNLLKKLGYHPETVKNGLEAVEKVQTSPCDLILMDCYMPEVDGREATRIIRRLENENALPNLRPIQIIGVTANASLSEKRSCLDAGMDSFISKPLMSNPLNERLMNLWIELNLNRLDQTMAEDIINEFEEVATTLANLRSEIGSEATNELIQDFIEGTPERMNEMQTALSLDSMTDLRRIAHSYKAVCQIYGLTLMSSLCAKLEMQALSDNKEEAQLLIDQIRQFFNAVLPVIKSVVTDNA